MHILIIPSWYPTKENPINGTFFREQALALKNAGNKVGVLYIKNRSLKKFYSSVKYYKNRIEFYNDNGIKTYRCSGVNFTPKTKITIDMLTLIFFKRYITNEGMPDIIHAHSFLPAGIIATLIKKKYNIPIILTEHASVYAKNQIDQKEIDNIKVKLELFDDLIAVSQPFIILLNKLFDTRKFQYFPNLLPRMFEEIEIKDNKLKDKLTILNVASLNYNKGHDLLLKSLERVLKRGNVELRIGGDGTEKENIKQLSIDLGIEDKVKFIGQLSREETLEEMRNCNMFVLSSRYETFGVVVIEAHACGRPVIATKCGGPESIITADNGILVENNSKKELEKAILFMVKNLDKYNSNEIRKECIKNYGHLTFTNNLLKRYRSIINHPK